MSSKSKKASRKPEAAKPASQAEPAKSSLPFEPTSNRKKAAKKAPTPAIAQTDSSPKSGPTAAKQTAAIPQVVSQRMARRMGFFCGIPTSLGILTFIASYVIVTQHWFKLPNIAVVLVSMGFFGLGVLGLSYGVLSSSWDEERIGSWHGWEEFSRNFGRLVESWRSARQKSSS